MKIGRIECLPLRSRHAAPDDCDGTVDTAVIRITADNGMYGLGETDAPPNAIAALLETPTAHIWSRSVRDILLGKNPVEVESLWDQLYEGTIYHGRRGLGIMLMSAIDNALHDLRGKILGLPVFQVLGGAARAEVTPYATLFPSMPQGRSWQEMQGLCFSLIDQALTLGFRALKMEMLFDDLVSDRELVQFIYECRKRAEEERDFMIDVGYRWKNFNDALWVLRRVEDAKLFFVEAPLQTDDLDGLARLADSTTTPVAVGEFLQTRHEFRELMDRGHCDVIQPDLGRVGGLTEALRTARWRRNAACIACRMPGKQVLPPLPPATSARWFPTALTPSYSIRIFSRLISARTSPSRKSHCAREDGPFPSEPGMGVDLDMQVVEECLLKPATVID